VAQVVDHSLVLVVGDDLRAVAEVRAILEPVGYRIDAVADPLAAMLAVRRDRPAAVFVGAGVEALAWVRPLIGICRLGARTPIMLIGDGLSSVARSERVPYLALPLDPAQLRAAVAPPPSGGASD
jgi:hypothetical protein